MYGRLGETEAVNEEGNASRGKLLLPQLLKSNGDLDAIWGLCSVQVNVGNVLVEDYRHIVTDLICQLIDPI